MFQWTTSEGKGGKNLDSIQCPHILKMQLPMVGKAPGPGKRFAGGMDANVGQFVDK